MGNNKIRSEKEKNPGKPVIRPQPEHHEDDEFDVAIIGSGFGGCVAALRLIEKGYRVVVLEAGRRFDEQTLPKTSWHLRSFLWAPLLGCFSIQRISLLKNALILSGAGVGGGSLVYANTLYQPPSPFYSDSQWSATDHREGCPPAARSPLRG